MEYRLLGKSGLKVPVLSLGTATFGGVDEFFNAFGGTDVAEATRLVDICLEAALTMFDSADVYSGGHAEEILGQAIKGRRDQVLISTKATFGTGPGPNDVGSSRYHLIASGRGQPAPPGHRLHRPVPAARLRRDDAGRGDAAHARRPGARRQDPLHRLLELLRLAPDEVAGGLRTLRLGALRGAPGLLLAGRPRVRMGADAAGARPERGQRGVEPAGLGPADRQDPPRPAAAGVEPARNQSAVDGGPQVADEYLYRVVDALDAVAKETGKTVSADRAQLAAAASDRVHRDHRRAQRGAAAREPRRGGLEALTRAHGAVGQGQRNAQDLSLLAPGRFRSQPFPAG